MSTFVLGTQINPDRLAQLRVTLARDLTTIVQDANRGVNVVVRDLRPTDLNNGTLKGAVTTGALTADTLASDAYSSWTALTATQAVGIYGLANTTASPAVSEVQFIAGPYTLAITEIGMMYAANQTFGYFVDPITWLPTEHVNISYLSPTTQTDTVEWMGYIAEQDKLVAPPRLTANRDGKAVVAGHV